MLNAVIFELCVRLVVTVCLEFGFVLAGRGSSYVSQVDPLFAFAFIQAFIDILHEYFGNVSAGTLKDNFDVVYQVKSSMV